MQATAKPVEVEVEEVKKVTLFIKNISEQVTEEDLTKMFESVPVVAIRLIKDEWGVNRGIAFVDVPT